MRNIFCGCFFVLGVFHSLAQGVQFQQISWDEALVKANAEGKLVFLDAVASWCGPCRIMSKEVFPDSALGALFNRHFLSVKLDMEKAEGIEVSNRYKVWVYPTLLFVDGSGAVRHRSTGYHSVRDMLSLGKTALDPANCLAGMDVQYAAGNRKRDFLLQYLKVKTAAYDPEAGRLANEFLKTEDSLDTPENMDLIMQYVKDPYSRGFRFLLMNRADFEEQYGKREVKGKIASVFDGYLEANPELPLGEVQRLYATIYPERGAELASRYRIEYYRKNNEPEQFVRASIEHYQRYPSEDPDELIEAAWLFSEEVNDESALLEAVNWTQKAIAIRETAYAQYTLGKLWLKIGRKKTARAAAERSVELSKAAGEDSFLMEELLKATRKQR